MDRPSLRRPLRKADIGVDWKQVFLVALILLFAIAYYGLAFLALRDLWRRPAVRGDNKVIWGLAIICLPIVGALFYGYMGAASFLPRSKPVPSRLRAPGRKTGVVDRHRAGDPR